MIKYHPRYMHRIKEFDLIYLKCTSGLRKQKWKVLGMICVQEEAKKPTVSEVLRIDRILLETISVLPSTCRLRMSALRQFDPVFRWCWTSPNCITTWFSFFFKSQRTDLYFSKRIWLKILFLFSESESLPSKNGKLRFPICTLRYINWYFACTAGMICHINMSIDNSDLCSSCV